MFLSFMQSSIQSLMLSLTHSLNVSFFHAIIHSIIHAFFLSLIQLLNVAFFSSNHPFNYSRFLSFTHSITQSFFLSFKMADAHVLASAVFVTHSALLNATCIFLSSLLRSATSRAPQTSVRSVFRERRLVTRQIHFTVAFTGRLHERQRHSTVGNVLHLGRLPLAEQWLATETFVAASSAPLADSTAVPPAQRRH
jgi:hypothetical protein